MTDQGPRRVLNLTEVGVALDMKRSNVAKFLARRGIEPTFSKAQGYLWDEDVILNVKAEREADARRMESDRLRREAALRRRDSPEPVLGEAAARLGERQRVVLSALAQRPLHPSDDATRLACRRLAARGLAELVPGERGLYQLTTTGREVAGQL